MMTGMMTDADREPRLSARRHITNRFGDLAREAAWGNRRCLAEMTAVDAVADAIEFERPVDAEDVRAGLRLIPGARVSFIASEIDLIRHARKIGLTWDEIGSLLGVGDRRAAQQRYTRLQKRFEAALDSAVGDPGD